MTSLAGYFDRLSPGRRAVAVFCTATSRQQARQAWREWLSCTPQEDGPHPVLNLAADMAGGSLALPSWLREVQPVIAFCQQNLHRLEPPGITLPGLAGPDGLIRRLRAAALLEERRLQALREVCAGVLALPCLQELEPVLAGGLPLGETVYPDPSCRHTSSLNLVVAAGVSLRRLKGVMADQGYSILQAGWRSFAWPGPLASSFFPRLRLRHPSGLPLLVEAGGSGGLSWSELRAACRRLDYLPSAAGLDHPGLAHTLILTARPPAAEVSRRSLLWLLDALYLWQFLQQPAGRATGQGSEPDSGLLSSLPPRPLQELRQLAERVEAQAAGYGPA